MWLSASCLGARVAQRSIDLTSRNFQCIQLFQPIKHPVSKMLILLFSDSYSGSVTDIGWPPGFPSRLSLLSICKMLAFNFFLASQINYYLQPFFLPLTFSFLFWQSLCLCNIVFHIFSIVSVVFLREFRGNVPNQSTNLSQIPHLSSHSFN